MSKFLGTTEEFMEFIDSSQLGGWWDKCEEQKYVYRTGCGGVINWWPKPKTIYLQGDKYAIELIESVFLCSGDRANGLGKKLHYSKD